MKFITYSPEKSLSIYQRNHGQRIISNIQFSSASFHNPNESFCCALLHGGEIRYTDFYGWFGSFERFYIMARYNSAVEFVNIRLTADDKPRVAKFVSDVEPDFAEHLINFIGSGYKVSINLDEANDCYIVAATGTQNSRENKGKCMTTRSGDLFECLYMMLYKHEMICDNGSWGEPVNQTSDWG